MTRKRTRSRRLKARQAAQAAIPVKQVGLFVTAELDDAIAACREKVQQISRDCRKRNKKFRDLEFDVEFDEHLCLHGLSEYAESLGKDVQRVTELFDEPKFFPAGGAVSSNAIKQGSLGDCWFLSALATVSCVPNLIEKICVERDEEVGVYGFIFYGDDGWRSVIIDDMLYTNIPKFEELDLDSKELYHNDKEKYTQTARKHGASLLYARAGSQDEMWVPLIEKAYAKFYGNFAHLSGGWTREAVVDLTGGVATAFITKDILDLDQFWKQELTMANKDRVFACSFSELKKPWDHKPGDDVPTVEGLYGNHAYAILRAVECNGKRFVVLRNPWGKGEWTGAWSDGSKQWTKDWVKILPELGHTFGNDGQFVMDYEEFLRCFNVIERTFLFDDSWIVASQWVNTPLRDQPSAWSYGTLSFVVTMPAKSKAILVLSRLNTRAYRSIRSSSWVMIDLAVVKKGDNKPIEVASEARPFNSRNVSIELELDEGDYFVYVRLDQFKMVSVDGDGYGSDYGYSASSRTLSRILARKVDSYSLASNWTSKAKKSLTATTLQDVIQEDLERIAKEESGTVGDDTAASSDDEEPKAPGPSNGSSLAVQSGVNEAEVQPQDSTHLTIPPQKLEALDSIPPAPSTSSTPASVAQLFMSLARSVRQAEHPWDVVSDLVRIGVLNLLALFGLTLLSAHVSNTSPSNGLIDGHHQSSGAHGDSSSVDSKSDQSQSPPNSPTVQAASPLSQASLPSMLLSPYVTLQPASETAGQEWKELLKDETGKVVLGLRVYTQTKDPAKIVHRLNTQANGS